MSLVAIRAESVSKSYRLGKRGAHYGTLRDAITGLARSIRNPRRTAREPVETLWALKNISFEIQQGEVVGLVGRNGAGKSTLLKVLSRITAPAEGTVHIRGRVGSLLEVGTGFHQELTGRENIFLNGAILGMRRAEIARKFDEIVAFAEVDRFLDTQVKFYSSGMYVRLAFAVAAHLEPEILLVDEVLAVGDARFQRKCLNKMQHVGSQGRTVIFVSHTMAAVTRLCPRAIFLQQGQIVDDGPSAAVVSKYMHGELGTTSERRWPSDRTAPGDEVVRLLHVRVLDEAGSCVEVMDIRKPLAIEVSYEITESGHVLSPLIGLSNGHGVDVFSAIDLAPEWRGQRRPAGVYKSVATIPGNLLSEGLHLVSISLVGHEPLRRHFTERDVVAFNVIDSSDGDSARGEWTAELPGVVRPMLRWCTERAP